MPGDPDLELRSFQDLQPSSPPLRQVSVQLATQQMPWDFSPAASHSFTHLLDHICIGQGGNEGGVRDQEHGEDTHLAVTLGKHEVE